MPIVQTVIRKEIRFVSYCLKQSSLGCFDVFFSLGTGTKGGTWGFFFKGRLQLANGNLTSPACLKGRNERVSEQVVPQKP